MYLGLERLMCFLRFHCGRFSAAVLLNFPRACFSSRPYPFYLSSM